MTDLLETEQDRSDRLHDGGARRAIRIFGWTTIGFGLFLLGFVGHQLFVTTYFAQQANEGLTAEATSRFADVEISEVPYLDPTIGPCDPANPTDPADPFVDPEVTYPTLLVEAPPDVGEPFAIITIPSIERLAGGWAVVEGVSRQDPACRCGPYAEHSAPRSARQLGDLGTPHDVWCALSRA